MMKRLAFLLALVLAIGLLIYYAGLKHAPVSVPVKPVAVERRPDLTAIFTIGNYQRWIDRFGTVSLTAFDPSGKRIGTQVGHVGGPNGIVVEMTYLAADADHPLGQAFDGQGNPIPLDTGPDQPMDGTEQAPRVS